MEGKYACCCGPCTTHVEKGAFVIAIIGIILNVASLIGSFFTIHPWTSVGHLLAILLYLSIIFAQRKSNSKLYLPYLIIMGVCLVLAIPIVVIIGVAGYITFAVVLLISLILNGYFYSVIFRAYKYLKEQNSTAAGKNQQKV